MPMNLGLYFSDTIKRKGKNIMTGLVINSTWINSGTLCKLADCISIKIHKFIDVLVFMSFFLILKHLTHFLRHE